MAPADVPDGLRLSSQSGWNQREEDWRLLLSLGRGRFRVATEGGRVVATGGTVAHGGRLGWICMILVDAERRGGGLGTLLFADVLAHAGGLSIVGLDATPRGRPVYERAGFEASCPLIRLERAAAPVRARAADAIEIRPLGTGDLDAVLARDRGVFGADRGPVLRWAFDQAPEYAWGAFDHGALLGYLFGRHGRRFEHLGPLVADEARTSEGLLQACLHVSGARPVGLDVPAEKSDWGEFLVRQGFREARPFTRMYRRGEGDPGEPGAVFAVVGPEFG
jgi:GNAT superfamily N-acetyltransferase